MVYNLYTVKLERPKVVRYEHKYEGLYQMFCTLVRGVIMFMLSLMQPSGLYELEKDSLEAISAQLLQMIQMKSYHLYTHSIQVSNYAVSIAAKMGLPLNEIEQIRHAALLHDVGLLMVPNALIQKSPYLNKQEMSKYKQHAASGANMIENYPCCQQILP